MMWWTPELDQKLKKDFRRIGSLRAVAREWGFTPNQVISRAQRLGMTAYKRETADRDYAPIKEPRKRRATTARSKKVAKSVSQVIKPIVAPVEITMAPSCDPVSILDIREGECRWVLEGHFMCGAPAYRAGGSWCGYHKRLVFVPASKRRDEGKRLAHDAVAKTMRMMQSVIPQGW